MDLIVAYLGLRYLVQLLKAGDAGAAGDRQNRDISGTVDQASSCLGIGCGCIVVLCVMWMIGAAIDWLVASIFGR